MPQISHILKNRNFKSILLEIDSPTSFSKNKKQKKKKKKKNIFCALFQNYQHLSEKKKKKHMHLIVNYPRNWQNNFEI